MNALVAIDINSSTIDFGTLSPGESSPGAVNVSNYGNIEIDVRLNGTNLTCDQGSMAVGNLLYNCTDPITVWELDAGKGDQLTTTLTTCTDFNLTESSDTSSPSPTNNTIYWRILAPYGGAEAVEGACSGTIWFLGTSS